MVERGLRIPDDIALIGFNDIEFTAWIGIQLTTVGQKKFEMGEIATKTLVEKVEAREAKTPTKEVFLKPELIIRKSCGFHLKGYQIESQNKDEMDFFQTRSSGGASRSDQSEV